ncbi:MAG: S8 family peptidase [Bacteriovoracaceae bacterium]|nr:S8 family peptidase [Bacteriovoracaceae bacterium]
MKKIIKPLAVLSLTASFAAQASYPQYIAQDVEFESLERLGQLKKQSKILKVQRKNVKGDILNTLGKGGEPHNWFNLSPEIDGIEGVGTERVYKLFGAPTNEVIVAVIDSGVDVNHEDLQGKVWINEDEIAGNGIDDDNNGYVDDVYGWNFIGNEKGMAKIEADDSLNGYKLIKGDPKYQVTADTLEMTREVVRLRKLKKELNRDGYYLLPGERLKLERLSAQVESESKSSLRYFTVFKKEKKAYDAAVAVLKAAGVEKMEQDYILKFKPANDEQDQARDVVLNMYYQGYTHNEVSEYYEHFKSSALYHYNLESDTRAEIVGDNINDKSQRVYGNNDVIGADSSHGTHVAGIIAAARQNGIGMDGVASNVKIMAIRAVPNGDERDKDIANSIYYAVDNGAKVINMSFGKSYSPYKTIVDEAVKYAESKGVILVHAAGNSSKNIDENDNFPNKNVNGKDVSNWLEVGASAYLKGSYLPAGFSNYGKRNVDVFAPGKNIHATFPDNTYSTISGTSMASPVVAGVAALILGYVPDLEPAQLKEVIMSTTSRYPYLEVSVPGAGTGYFSELSVSGGVINAFNALNILTRETQVPYLIELANN